MMSFALKPSTSLWSVERLVTSPLRSSVCLKTVHSEAAPPRLGSCVKYDDTWSLCGAKVTEIILVNIYLLGPSIHARLTVLTCLREGRTTLLDNSRLPECQW